MWFHEILYRNNNKCYRSRKTLHICCWEHQVIAESENLVRASDALVFELVEARGLFVIANLPDSDNEVRSHRGGQWMVIKGIMIIQDIALDWRHSFF